VSSLFTLPAGRTSKWVVFGVWLVIVVVSLGLNLPGKFTEAEKNNSASFLPGDAESTKVLDITERLNDGEKAPTVIVYRRESGLTAADKRAIAADIEKLDAISARFDNTSPWGNPEGPDATTPFQLSEDGTAALIGNQLTGTGEAEDLIDPVEAYREAVTRSENGLVVKVTGPSGVAADAVKVFENINGTLLAAAFTLVIVLLILIYRSPFFWFFPILAVVFAEIATRGLGYGLTEMGVTVNGQSSSILSVLVIGAGTDYALLLVARYREELRKHEDKHEAMNLALRRAGPAILASGATVCAALLTLSLAQVNGTAGLGPIGAMGVAVAVVSMLTFLPAVLLIVGRRPFWPFIPHFGDEGSDETHGAWRTVAERVAAHPARVAVASTAVLVVFSLGLLNFDDGLTQSNSFTDSVESIEGQNLVASAFPSGQSVPTDIVVPADADLPAVARAAAGVDNVASVSERPAARDDENVQLTAFFEVDPYSTEAFDTIPAVRAAVRDVEPAALVGGGTAVEADLREASSEDNRLLVPLALVVVFLVLVALLRALVIPLVLIATVVLSFLAALGVGAVVFDVVFGFPGSDPSLPLFSFIFLVALGVDYNIFLMTRAREETFTYGTRRGIVRAVAVTGGVITAAGIVLAGTFSVLAVLPLVFLTEIGFVVAFGVLLDTFLVRSVLVPSLVHLIGPNIWWPSALAREAGHAEEQPDKPERVAEPV
jgi:RND superfamily putative drug exporter